MAGLTRLNLFFLLTGFRSNTAETDLSDVLPDGLDAKVKQEAEVSIGTDIAPDDLEQVLNMCDEV